VRVLDFWTVHHEGEDHLVFVEERAMRFVTWPGLDPPGIAGRDPDAVAREVVASKPFSRTRPGFAPAFLGLVPVAHSADLSAVVGWVAAASDVASDLKVAPVLRSWEERFGAQVVALTDGIYLSVAAPPRTREHAQRGARALHWALAEPDHADGQPTRRILANATVKPPQRRSTSTVSPSTLEPN
jgi:hypothetical protein